MSTRPSAVTEAPAEASPEPAAAAPHAAELERLRVRVVALENLVIALLAEGTQPQLDRARAMAAYISPRPGFTTHRVTLQAATQMVHLAERAGHFRDLAAG